MPWRATMNERESSFHFTCFTLSGGQEEQVVRLKWMVLKLFSPPLTRRYNGGNVALKGAGMILSEEQQKAVANGEALGLNVDGVECVLVRRDIYLRLDPDYDTGPWTTDEMNL